MDAVGAPDGALLIVGGGRWARVYLSILGALETACSEIVVVSRHGGDALAAALARATAAGKRRFTLARDLDHALSRGDIYGAIVVNAGRKHVETAGRLIENHVPVLVEKPVALMLSEAERLIAVAAASETMVMPSLAMRYCQYLRNFRDAAVEEGIGPCTSVDMRWIDPSGEVRYGAAKVADPSLGIAEDVATHISTLLSVVCGEASFRIDKAEITRGGLAVSLAGAWGEIAFNCALEREAARRERLVVLRDAQGRKARLDFATEPGSITLGASSRSADPAWAERPTPLTQQVIEFLAMGRRGYREEDADRIRSATAFTVRAAELVRIAQWQWLESAAGRQADPFERLIAMRELLAPLLIEAGLVAVDDSQHLGISAQQALELMATRPGAVSLLELCRILGGTRFG